MKQVLFKRYFLSVAFIVIAMLGIMFFSIVITYNNHMSEEKHSELKNACNTVSQFICDAGNNSEINAFRAVHFIMSNISEVTNCDVYVTDSHGTITICACNDWGKNAFCEHTGTKINTEVLKDAADDKERLSTAGIYSAPHYISATEFKLDSGVSGYVFCSSASESVKGLVVKSLKIYFLSAIIPIIIMFLALYYMTYRTTKPLRLMSEAAKSMSKGDFSKRIPVTSDDEIGELAASFNGMTNSLARLEETRKSFIANVSHEMRTPMTTIGGFIDGIIDGTIEPQKQEYYLKIASEEVKRLSRMIQSMLNLARLESSEFVLKKESFDLKELILNVVISQEQRIEDKKINIEGLDALESVTVNADKDLIHQALYNLVDNAIKFVNTEGTLIFETGVDTQGVKFTLTNSGEGIPAGDLPLIFDRFYKLDKSRSVNKNSMGLGLYIVKTIIKNHGGTISVKSKENEFTTFEFVLPLGK